MNAFGALRRKILSVTTAEKVSSSYEGFIDGISSQGVMGWARQAGNPDPVVMNIYSGDTMITWGTANIFREDLKAAGKGEGNHGFNIPLPPDTDTSSLRFVIEGGSEIAHNHFAASTGGAPGSFEPGSSELITVWLEISDLIHYVRHHKTVSGIQRVQCELVRLIVANNRFRVRFCITDEAGSRYYEIPFGAIETLITRIDTNSTVSLADWVGYTSSLADTSKLRNADIAPGDILFLLGAFWNFPDSIYLINGLRHSGVKIGVYIYDLIPIFQPEYCDKNLVRVFTNSFAMLSQMTDLIFTISQYTANEVNRFYEQIGQKPTFIKPILLAHEMRKSKALSDRRGRQSSLIDPAEGPFVLCVCTIEIRKNHLYLLRIWRELIKKHGKGRIPKLILVGRRGWRVDDFFSQLEGTNYLDNHVQVLHDLSDAELQALYQNCLFTVFPSFCEGWGLPVGESLVFGKICIASGTTSIPEVAEEFAVSIDPDNVNDGLQTIERFILDDQLRTRTEKELQKRFRPRSWDDVAAAFIDGIDQYLRNGTMDKETLPAGRMKLGDTAFLGRADNLFNPMSAVIDHPGQQLICTKNWYPPEPWGRWMSSRSSFIDLALDESKPLPEKVRIYLRMLVPAQADQVKLSVTSGCGASQEIVISRPGDIYVSLDCATRPKGSSSHRIKLSLVLDRSFTPTPPDARSIGMGIKSVGIVDPADVLQRLDFMEKMLLSAGI